MYIRSILYEILQKIEPKGKISRNHFIYNGDYAKNSANLRKSAFAVDASIQPKLDIIITLLSLINVTKFCLSISCKTCLSDNAIYLPKVSSTMHLFIQPILFCSSMSYIYGQKCISYENYYQNQEHLGSVSLVYF